METTIHYNPRGYEASYDEAKDCCTVVVRGCRDGEKIVERGGPGHPDDRVVARIVIPGDGTNVPVQSPVRDTFIDVLADRRDLLGNFDFRRKPADDAERRLFAAAFDAAQRIRSKMSVLGCDKLLFTLLPSAFATVDCFARDPRGFWLMQSAVNGRADDFVQTLPMAAYILERGGYVPATASVRLGVWNLTAAGAKFAEIPNNRAAARDLIIDHLCDTPF